MSTVIGPEAVRAAIDMNDLELDLPNDPELQRKVNEHFPTVFDTWAQSSTVDPYDALSEDYVEHADGVCIPGGVSVDSERARDIFSACAHTIREAVRRVSGADPCSSASDLTF